MNDVLNPRTLTHLERLEAEAVVGLLNDYLSQMTEIILAHQGMVDKFIGDAIMAHWGALVSHGNNTENAVTAAVMMRKALIEFNARPLLNGKPKPQANTRTRCAGMWPHRLAWQCGPSSERRRYPGACDA